MHATYSLSRPSFCRSSQPYDDGLDTADGSIAGASAVQFDVDGKWRDYQRVAEFIIEHQS